MSGISTNATYLSQIHMNDDNSEEIVVEISNSNPENLGILIDNHYDIYSVSADKILIIVTSDQQLQELNILGLKPNIIYSSIAEMEGWISDPWILESFHDYTTLTAELQNIASLYPEITQLYDIGESVQGRSIWGLKITDNPTIEEAEPEVRVCGLHHGNELMSTELPLLLAWHLVQNYSSDQEIQDLVDNREIWIIPMVNPDGREASPNPTRYNANGVDLNRDYGYMWDAWNSPAPFSQPETQVIRDNALDNNFVLSLSYHTSGDIVNYIWNYKQMRVPDDDVVEYLSLLYGSYNSYWVTDGYEWYQTRGDTNDFSYGCRGDIDWTIEVQNSNIPQAWDLNRDAMIDIISAADMGLSGVVTDSVTDEPLEATIWVEEVFWPCFTDPILGDYHRVLFPGTYTVHFQANGYQEKMFTVAVDDDGTVFNVALDPEGEVFGYQVTWCNFYDPYNYPNNFQNNPTEAIAALGPPDGNSASLGVGGEIVIDFGQTYSDLPDAVDIQIVEGDDTDEGYSVFGSLQWDGPWIFLGDGVGTSEFDLANVSLNSLRFVKIVDDDDGNAYEDNPGFDFDAIQFNLPSEIPNQPPMQPLRPSGPGEGKVGETYLYSSSSYDPEGSQILFMWDWGDGEFSGWVGPYNSNETVSVSHTWTEKGDYDIRVKCKDMNGTESNWSESLSVSMPKVVSNVINQWFSLLFERVVRIIELFRLFLNSITE